MQTRVAIIVVNYGSSDLLAQNLTRVTKDSPQLKAYVVDNFTTHIERDNAAALSEVHGWDFLPQNENHGFGGGVNIGAEAALRDGATDLLLLNPDATISAADMGTLQAAAGANRHLVAAPVIKTTTGQTWFAGVSLDLESGDMRRSAGTTKANEVDWVTGACMWITAAAWAAVGPFDEDYFLYWEDVDYSYRARDAGMTVAVISDALAVHDEGGTQTASEPTGPAKSKTYYYYNIRNRMLFSSRHLSESRIRSWRRRDVAASYQILLRGGRRQFVTSPTVLFTWLRAVRDGRRIARSALSDRPGFRGSTRR